MKAHPFYKSALALSVFCMIILLTNGVNASSALKEFKINLSDTTAKPVAHEKINSRAEQNKKLKKDVALYVRKFSIDAPTIDLVDASVPNQTFFNYISGRFSGLTINRGPNGNFVFKGHGQASLGSLNTSDSSDDMPVFYIDEAMVELDDVRILNLNNVALIRFAQSPVWFAPSNGGAIGALLIYLKKTDTSR